MPSLIAVTVKIKANGRTAIDPAAAPKMGKTGKECEQNDVRRDRGSYVVE